MTPKNPFGSPFGSYVGGSSFVNGRPVCKPIAPGRRIKPLEGPVHPGFAGKPKAPKPAMPAPYSVMRSTQNNDLYQHSKKRSK
jgi:hypothetical protein